MKITQNVIAIEGHKNASSDKRSNAMDKILPLKKKKPNQTGVLKKKKIRQGIIENHIKTKNNPVNVTVIPVTKPLQTHKNTCW